MRKVLIKAKAVNGPTGQMETPKSYTGSPDGIRCEVYNIGDVYEMPDGLAASFVLKGKADFVGTGNPVAPKSIQQMTDEANKKTTDDRNAKIADLLKKVQPKAMEAAPENKMNPAVPAKKTTPKKG